MQSMAAFRDYVRLFAWKPKTKAEGLEAHRAILLVLCCVVAGYYGERCDMHGGVRVSSL